MKANYEYTDTFGGEANYSWVKRGTVEAGSVLGVIRRVKSVLGLQGVRCTKTDFGDSITLKPSGMCTALFINFEEG